MEWSVFPQVIHNLHIKKVVLVAYGSKINEPSPWCRKSSPDHHCHWFILKNDLCHVEFARSGGMLQAFVAVFCPTKSLACRDHGRIPCSYWEFVWGCMKAFAQRHCLMTPLRGHLADSLSDVLCYSGMFEDNTFMYMIEPLELIHDEVGLWHQFSYGV